MRAPLSGEAARTAMARYGPSLSFPFGARVLEVFCYVRRKGGSGFGTGVILLAYQRALLPPRPKRADCCAARCFRAAGREAEILCWDGRDLARPSCALFLDDVPEFFGIMERTDPSRPGICQECEGPTPCIHACVRIRFGVSTLAEKVAAQSFDIESHGSGRGRPIWHQYLVSSALVFEMLECERVPMRF